MAINALAIDARREKPFNNPSVVIVCENGNTVTGVVFEQYPYLKKAVVLLEQDLPGYNTVGHLVHFDISKLERISPDSQQWHPDDILFRIEL